MVLVKGRTGDGQKAAETDAVACLLITCLKMSRDGDLRRRSQGQASVAAAFQSALNKVRLHAKRYSATEKKKMLTAKSLHVIL